MNPVRKVLAYFFRDQIDLIVLQRYKHLLNERDACVEESNRQKKINKSLLKALEAQKESEELRVGRISRQYLALDIKYRKAIGIE